MPAAGAAICRPGPGARLRLAIGLEQIGIEPQQPSLGQVQQKLGGSVSLDVMRSLQAFDAGGCARAASLVMQVLTAAKETGVDPTTAVALVDWD